MTRKRRAEWKQAAAEWTEFLKEDYDWDYHFIIRTLKYKLERTRKRILKNNMIVKAKEVAAEILEVEKLLQRVLDDEYEDEMLRPYYKKYGRPKMVLKPIEGSKHKKLEFLYKGKPATKAMWSEYKRIANKAWAVKVADLRAAFSLMEKNIWSWWD